MRTLRFFLLSTTLVLATSLVVGAQGGARPAQGGQASPRRYSGTPIDVDYQAANLRTVLRNLSEIGGINLVIDPSVPTSATVDLKLSQVPWDQVMDVVLKSAQLTYELDGPVLRVLTRDARTKELQAEADQKRASQAAPDLAMRRIKLNYSPAADVKKLLEDARIVSERGSVEVNERTNMLIIQDLPHRLPVGTVDAGALHPRPAPTRSR